MHRRPWQLLTIVVLLTTALVAFAACGDGDDGEPPTATPGVPPDATAPLDSTPDGAEPTDVPFAGGRDPISGSLADGTPPSGATLVRVEAGEHEGFDRIVFEFADVGSGYTVAYVDDPIACGSGDAVSLDGEAFLEISLTPAQAHDDAGGLTIDATELSPGLPAIVAAVQSCDFEGVVTWVVGLAAEADFRVAEVAGPLRLAVDIAHP